MKTGYKIWQEGGGHDLNIWSMKKAIEKSEYFHVTMALVLFPLAGIGKTGRGGAAGG